MITDENSGILSMTADHLTKQGKGILDWWYILPILGSLQAQDHSMAINGDGPQAHCMTPPPKGPVRVTHHPANRIFLWPKLEFGIS